MVLLKAGTANLRRRRFLESSGLNRHSFETKLIETKPDRIYVVYRDPVTDKVMKKPDGRLFWRWKQFLRGGREAYRTCIGGGVHLYFPKCDQGKVTDYLKAHPDRPVYITEGEKKAAKAWLEGIPCVGISGIWCWLANREDRPNGEKKLHPDFDLIPDLERRGVIMVYDSDANDPEKKAEFDKCSTALETCLRARGVSRCEKVILPGKGPKKVGLDDYLMQHPVAAFRKVVAEQSKTVPLHRYIMTSRRFLSTNFPPINFVMQPWLTDCGLTMVHSAPGVGKTYFLLGMSVAITRKRPPECFCGWKIKKRAGVLFVDGEMPAPIMQQRLAKLEAAYPNNPASKDEKLWLLSGTHLSRGTGKAINLSDEHWRNYFSKILAHHPAKVIVLDNIVSLMGTRDENDAGAWSEINQWLLSLRAIGKSVIIVHHSSKHGKQRGTSHRSDNLDTILRLKRDGDEGFTVHFEKHRNFSGAEASPVSVDFQIDDDKAMFTQLESDESETADRDEEIWEMHKAGKSNKEIAKHFKLSPGRVSQILSQMAVDDDEDDDN